APALFVLVCRMCPPPPGARSPPVFRLFVPVMPPVYGPSRWLAVRVRRRVVTFNAAFERFSRGVHFVLRRMELTRIQAAERHELGGQARVLEEVSRTSREMAWFQMAYTVVHNTLFAAATMAMLLAGSALVARGSMTLA